MSDNKTSNQMWGGRFASGPAAIMQAINASISFDKKLYAEDISGSIAHSEMLAEQGIISRADQKKIAKGLKTILAEIESGKFAFSEKLEDIHMNVEARLAELIGPAAGRLHTARSRNDQVAVDFRLWVKNEFLRVAEALKGLIAAFLERAEEHAATVMPGFTHMQAAQPVTFGHHCMAYVEMFARDLSRVRDAVERMDESPLGAAALAGTGFPDRPAHDGQGARLPRADAQLAGFGLRPRLRAGVPVDRRDLSHASVAAGGGDRHLVDAAIRLREAVGPFSTGSSIMPQKKNPDAAELVRAKTGRVNGHLIGLLTVMKGLPLTYSKDMQEDKEAVFDAAETLDLMLAAMTGMVARHDDRRGCHEARRRSRVLDRHRPRRLAGAHAGSALPRGASRDRPRRGAGRGEEGRAGKTRAGRPAGDPSRHHGRRVLGAVGAEFGEEPHELRRHGADRGQEAGPRLEEAAGKGLV